MPNFQDNFGTNLTASTSAGATTSPINSIPTVDAPFYIAFDATNLNSHYEVLLCTSKTATNVNHAATTYDHTAAEEVRLVLPSVHLNTIQNLPDGTLINGKITPTDAAGLTLTLQTNAGATPSVTDPVYVKIGGTVRSITAALSVAKADGTNWCNSGGAELATKEVDYFAYLWWNATDSAVRLGYSRIPYAALLSDMDTTTTTAEKYFMTDLTNHADTDVCANIGRFSATLSAGAGYTWSVPTFTASNLIQRPIYETRWLEYTSVVNGSGGSIGTYAQSVQVCRYRVVGQELRITHTADITNKGSWSGNIQVSTPLANANTGYVFLFGYIPAVSGATSYWNANFYGPASLTAGAAQIMFEKGAANSIVQWADITATTRFTINGSYQI